MSDRLTELQRQRRLLQEHVAWLDREIAAESAKSGAPSAPLPAAVQSTPREPTALAAAAQRATTQLESTLPADAEAFLEQYATPPQSIQSDVKRGCFIYVALAAALLTAAVTALYFHSRAK